MRCLWSISTASSSVVPRPDRDQPLLAGGHQVFDQPIVVLLESDVAIREDADELAPSSSVTGTPEILYLAIRAQAHRGSGASGRW